METFLTHEKIDRFATDCQKAIRKYAVASGIGAALPIPGSELATDAVMASAMIDEVLRRFRLRQADIEMLNLEAKAVLLCAAKDQGCRLVGKAVTKRLLVQIAGGSALTATARRLVKYAPLLGQVISAGIGYAAMVALGNIVINECVRVRKSIILNGASRRIA